MHGTKESFTLESALKRGEYIAEGRFGIYLSNSAGISPLFQLANIKTSNGESWRRK
jgi:hypothetical protein